MPTRDKQPTDPARPRHAPPPCTAVWQGIGCNLDEGHPHDHLGLSVDGVPVRWDDNDEALATVSTSNLCPESYRSSAFRDCMECGAVSVGNGTTVTQHTRADQ